MGKSALAELTNVVAGQKAESVGDVLQVGFIVVMAVVLWPLTLLLFVGAALHDAMLAAVGRLEGRRVL